jgi:hypothetical protein
VSAVEEAVDAAVASVNAAAFEPLIRKAVEGIYEQLLGDVQDYLADNAQFNIKSHISMLQRNNDEQRKSIVRLTDQRADLLAALQGVMDILGRAESNASGNPEWDYVGPRVAVARAAIAKAVQS